jgi:S-adenosylmethionine-diacylglycerol 3-amino-3-carboxypropyl transferase
MTQVVADSIADGTVLVRTETELARAPASAITWGREAILFSACNEDSACELQAFSCLEGKRVFCVTAGGGRVLNLLANRPREIWAVDLNPAQNALLELKIAGMRELDHDGYLRFLGARPSAERIATYERLRPRLSPRAQNFFDDRTGLVESGALLQGKLERFFTRLAFLFRLGHPLGLSRLFSFEDLNEQRRYMQKWDTFLWRTIAQNVARRWVLQLFSGDPGFYRYVPKEIPLHRTIYERVHRYFWHHLARENSLLQIVFFGRYIYEPALPIYLNATTFHRVKAALEGVRIETITAMVDDALDYAGPEAFDAFSLSDISSYLDDGAHHYLFERAIRSARRGAKICSRSNLYHRPLAPEHARRIRRDAEVERDFTRDDHSCVHEFLVGEIE